MPTSAARIAWARTSASRKPNSRRFSLAPIPSATAAWSKNPVISASNAARSGSRRRARASWSAWHPGLVGQPAQAVLALVEPAAAEVLDAPVGVRLDVTAIDPDGRRPQEPGLFGGLLVGDLDHSNLGVTVKLRADALRQRDRAGPVGQPGVVSTSTRGRWVGGWPAGVVAGSSGLRDAAAGGHVVAVVVQEPLGQLQHGHDPLVGQPVVDDPVLTPGGDKAAPAQAG